MKAKVGVPILAVVMAAVIFVFSGAQDFPKQAFSWASADGTVVGPSAAESPAANYRYTVEGIQYINWKVAGGQPTTPGDPINVYYDPGDPAVSVATLQRMSDVIAAMAAMTVLACMALWFVIHSVLRQREPVPTAG